MHYLVHVVIERLLANGIALYLYIVNGCSNDNGHCWQFNYRAKATPFTAEMSCTNLSMDQLAISITKKPPKRPHTKCRHHYI